MTASTNKADRRYLFGDRMVEADGGLFCTLVRFESVYRGHCHCNLRRIESTEKVPVASLKREEEQA